MNLRSLSFHQIFFTAYILIVAGSIKAEAQRDAIITQANEEIRCRILDETPARFVYAYIGPKGKVLRNEIFKNLVKDFDYNRYDSDLVITDFDKSKSKMGQKENIDIPDKRKTSREKYIPGEQEEEFFTKAEKTKEQKSVINIDLSEAQQNSKPEMVLPNIEKVEQVPEKKATRLKPQLGGYKNGKQTPEPIGIAGSKQSEETATSKPKEMAKAVEITLSPKPDGVLGKNMPKNQFRNHLKWRIGAKVGIGNILDNTFEATNAYGLYQEKLLNGWDFGADLAFFPMEGFGIGAVYTDFTSSNSATNLNFINQISGTEASGSISNRISRKFIGPAIFLRKSMDYKTFVVLSLSPGLNLYSDKGEYNGVEFNFRGQEFGAAASLGLDFLLGNDIVGRDIILSLEAGYNRGKINSLDYGNGSGEILLDNPILLDRVDFSIGLRFMRFPKYLKK